MKRTIFVIALVLLLIFTFVACGGKGKNDVSEDNSEIIEGVGDATLDVDDIFDNNSGNSSDGKNGNISSGNSVSGGGSSNDASSEPSESSSSSDASSSSSSSSSGSQGGNTNVSIDYEDPSVWTEAVGGQ